MPPISNTSKIDKVDKEVVVRVSDLTKNFIVPHEKVDSLKGRATQLFRRVPTEKFTALRNINFEVKKGEFFGIVGRNGSGKSTLLKILAGVYQPTKGNVIVDGQMATFIELGVGFNFELSGRDNVFLNGAILGMTRKEVEAKFNDIVEFAELEEFIDQKIKNYSSGMQVRLAFAIAIQSEADIILIDEVLAVGDTNFQAKCYDVFRDLKRRGKTILFVGHDMSIIRDFCDRALLIHQSKIAAEGAPEKVINEYNYYNLEDIQREMQDKRSGDKEKRWGTGDLEIEDFWAQAGNKRKIGFSADDDVEFFYKIKAKADVQDPVVGFVMKNAQGLPLFVTNTKITNQKMPDFKKGQTKTISCRVENIFSNGAYSVSPAIASNDAKVFYDWIEDALKVKVMGRIVPDGLVQPKHKFKVNQDKK